MADGDIRTVVLPLTLDYLALADPNNIFLDIGGGFSTTTTDIVSTSIVDVSGRNTVRKAVITLTGRSIA